MLDEAGELAVASGEEMVVDGSGAERRRAFRRKLPFGRGAVLMVGDRSHIVGVADVSVTGAYLTTRAPVAAGEAHVLKLLLLPARVEFALPAEIVRVSTTSTSRPTTRAGWPSASWTSTSALASSCAPSWTAEPRRA